MAVDILQSETPKKFNEYLTRRDAPGRLKARLHQNNLGAVGLEARPVGVEGRRTGLSLKASRKKDADDLDNVLDFFGHEEGFVPRRRAPAVLSRVELAPAPPPVQAAPVKSAAGPPAAASRQSPRLLVSPGGEENTATPRSASRTGNSTAATPTSSRSASRTQNTSVSSTGSPISSSPPPEAIPKRLDFSNVSSVDSSVAPSPSTASASTAGKSTASNSTAVDFFAAPRLPAPSRPVVTKSAAPASSTKITIKKPVLKQPARILDNLNLSTASPSSVAFKIIFPKKSASPASGGGVSDSPSVGAVSGFGSPAGLDANSSVGSPLPAPAPAPAAKPAPRANNKRVSFHADPRKQQSKPAAAPAGASSRRVSVGGDADASLTVADETYQEDASWVLSESVAAADEEEAAKDKPFVPEMDENSGEEIVGEESGEPDFVIGEDGTRKSARYRHAPLQYWKGEKVVYGRRKSGTFPTVVNVETKESPAAPPPKAKKHRAISTQKPNEEAVKFPETDQPIVVPIRDATGKEVMKEIGRPASKCPISPGKVPLETKASTVLKGDNFSTRMITLAPISGTDSQKSDSTKIFYVVSGVLETEINGVKAILHAGAHFSVPTGNDFTLRNPQEEHPTALSCTTVKTDSVAAASSSASPASKKKKASTSLNDSSSKSKKKKTDTADASASPSPSKKKKSGGASKSKSPTKNAASTTSAKSPSKKKKK